MSTLKAKDGNYQSIEQWLTDWAKGKRIVPDRNWFYFTHMSVYLRVYKFGDVVRLDFASVSVDKGFQGKRLTTKLLDWLEPKHKELGFTEIKYESVLNDKFAEYITVKRGATIVDLPHHACAPSFIKRL